MKLFRINWLYIKIALYAGLLYTVVMIMQYVKSPSFSGSVDVIMGSPSQSRSLDWCSNSVQAIYSIKTGTTVRDPKRIQDLCRLSYSGYQAQEVSAIVWRPLLKSLDQKGQETILETDESLGFIRIGSLIYKVDGLNQKIDSLPSSKN